MIGYVSLSSGRSCVMAAVIEWLRRATIYSVLHTVFCMLQCKCLASIVSPPNAQGPDEAEELEDVFAVAQAISNVEVRASTSIFDLPR